MVSLRKWLGHFSCKNNGVENYEEKKSFSWKTKKSSSFLMKKGLKGFVVDQTCPFLNWSLLEVTTTVSLNIGRFTGFDLYVVQSPKLKTGYRYENQFLNPGFTSGFWQLCGYQYFCYEILFYLVSSYSPILSNFLNQNLQNVKTPERKLGSFV